MSTSDRGNPQLTVSDVGGPVLPYSAEHLRQAYRRLQTLLDALPIELMDDVPGGEREALQAMYVQTERAVTILTATALMSGYRVVPVGSGVQSDLRIIPPPPESAPPTVPTPKRLLL